MLSLAELQKVQKEVEEKRKAEAEAKKARKSNVDALYAHFEEKKDGTLWLIVRAQVRAQETAKGNIALHSSNWRKVKTAEGVDIVIPAFNPFISMK